MASPVIECPVSGRQRISLNRASLRRKRSMKAAAKNSAAAAANHEKSKPRVQKTRSVALQECVKTYFASLNSISRSIVLESEALQKLFGPDWENMNAKQQEELLNKHFVPNRVVEHYNSDRRSTSPSFSEAEPEIDVKPCSSRSSAKKESIVVTSDDEMCFSPKGKPSVSDITQLSAAVPRRKEKEPSTRYNVPHSRASAITSDDEGVDTPIDRMDPVRRSFRVSSRNLAESRSRSMSMRVSRSRQQQQANKSQAVNKKRSDTNPPMSPKDDDSPRQNSSVLSKPRASVQPPTQSSPKLNQQSPLSQPAPTTVPNHFIPLSRTDSVSSSVSSVSIPAFAGRSQKYSVQRQRHHSSRAAMYPSEHSPAAPQLTSYSRRSESALRLHHVPSALSLSNSRCVRFEDDDSISCLSQSSEISERRFVPITSRWQDSSAYSPRRSRANSQSPARMLDGRLPRTRSQSPGRMLDDSPRQSRCRSQSPGNYLDSGSSSNMLSDTEYYADSDITSQRSVTPESILELESVPIVRPSERQSGTGIHRSYSTTVKNRGGSSITTATSSFANPKKNVRRSLPRKAQHNTISELGSSFCTTPDFSLSSSQSLDSRTMTPYMDERLTSVVNVTGACHSKTESDIGYMSAGADELDADVKSLEIKSNRESGYLSCDSVPMEQSTFTKSLPLQRTNISSIHNLADTGCDTLDNW